MNAHYDNHANDIEYFDLHKPKIEVKKKSNFVDINDLSDSQVIEKLEEVEIRLGELTELYNNTKHEGTFTILSRLHSFKSVIRASMRKRKLETNESLRLKIIGLEQKLGNVDKDQEKKINHLNLVNENLKNEVKALKESGKKIKTSGGGNLIEENFRLREEKRELGLLVLDLQKIIAENKEAEKTKRHEINVINEKYKYDYLKEFIKNHVDEFEYKALTLKLKSM